VYAFMLAERVAVDVQVARPERLARLRGPERFLRVLAFADEAVECTLGVFARHVTVALEAFRELLGGDGSGGHVSPFETT
jgi:hypothetical protein